MIDQIELEITIIVVIKFVFILTQMQKFKINCH